MAVCPSQAISKAKTPQEDAIVKVDSEKCIGCQSCMVACPFGAMNFVPKQKAFKCDLCGGSPQCVRFCFYDCLSFVELTEQEQADRAKKVKVLVRRACREIGREEARRRRTAFSLEASKVTLPLPPTTEGGSNEPDFNGMLRRVLDR